MRKNTDILDFLENVVRTNTHSYQEDFQFDVQKLTKAALARYTEDRTFYWMSRPCGTWCLNERDIFIRDTFDHHAWTTYENEADKIKAFCVAVTGLDQGKPLGTIYPIDYKTQVPRIKKIALPAEAVILTLSEGQTVSIPCDRVTGGLGQLRKQYGTIEHFRYTVRDEHELQALIFSERFPLGRSPKGVKGPQQAADRRELCQR